MSAGQRGRATARRPDPQRPEAGAIREGRQAARAVDEALMAETTLPRGAY